MSERTKFFLAAFLLFVVVFLIYIPSLHYDFVGLDDAELVIRNTDIKAVSIDRLWRLVTRHYITLFVPVTMLSYWADYQIWHLTPFGFRFTNVVLHFLNGVLVLYLLSLLHKGNLWVALAGALIFTIHPVQIESVVWVAERKNVLSAFFFLWAVIAYYKGAELHGLKGELKWLISSSVVYLFAVLSKPSVMVFLFVVIIMNHFYFDGRQKIKERWWYYSILIVAGVLAGILTVWGTATSVEKYSFHGKSYWTNLFVMLTVFWRYIGLLLFPYGQNVLYSSRAFKSLFETPVLISVLGLVLFFFLLWSIRKRNRPAAFWFSWFVVMLLPVSNLIAPFPSLMNDRYLYLPIVGFFMGSFCLADQSLGFSLFNPHARVGRLWLGSLIVFLGLPFVLLTMQRLPEWESSDKLWEAAFRRSPRKDPRIYYFAGINQLDRGHFEESVNLFKESFAVDPNLDTRLALGTACVAAEQFDCAEEHLKEVIKRDPTQAGALDQLGALYRKTLRYEEAEQAFQQAIKLRPFSAVFLNNYALLLLDLDRPEQAKQMLQNALRLDPDCHFALRNMSWFHFLRGELNEAAPYLVRYLRRDPNDQEMRLMAESIQSEWDRQQFNRES